MTSGRSRFVEMRKIELKFHGYTWEEYFYTIANRSGILVTYKGGLDCDGFVKMDEILLVEGADIIGDIYENKHLTQIRKNLYSGERLFFSFAEIEKGRDEVVEILNNLLIHKNSQLEFKKTIALSCNGACSLFPEEIL